MQQPAPITLIPLLTAGGLAFVAVRTSPGDVRGASSAADRLTTAGAAR